MKNTRGSKKFRWMYCAAALVMIRFIILSVRAFLPFGFPHVWRQVDTLSVGLRYWLRWTAETSDHLSLLPAVLNSGDTLGIMPMELPILNLFAAPFFSLGPYWGKSFAILGHTLLCLLLTLVNARIWRLHKVSGVSAYPAMFLLPLMSFSGAYFGRFMPDYISMILVTIAVGLAWEKVERASSFFLATIGLLMKPTSVCIFGLLLLSPNGLRRWKAQLLWVVAAVAISVLYYTAGLKWVDSYREIPALFATEWRPFFESLVGFFSDGPALLEFLAYRPFFPGGFFLVFGAVLWWSVKSRESVNPGLWIVALAQFLVICGLDGQHAYGHTYYFIGLSPTCALIFSQVLERVERSWFKAVFIVPLVVSLVEASLMDLKTGYHSPKESIWLLDRQCADLKGRNPGLPWGRGRVFRASPEPFPRLGLCFGERQGSMTSEYGFFWADEGFPQQCRSIDQTENIVLTRCVNSK